MSLERKIGQKAGISDPWSPHRPTRRMNKRKVKAIMKKIESLDERVEFQLITLGCSAQNSKGTQNEKMARRDDVDAASSEF